jgi:hypothetical protein
MAWCVRVFLCLCSDIAELAMSRVLALSSRVRRSRAATRESVTGTMIAMPPSLSCTAASLPK